MTTLRCLVCCGVAALVVGCGPRGPTRYALSGAVTFGGQPVRAGAVTLTPANAQPGEQDVVAPIRNGRYATRPGEGTLGGPHTVRINGFDAEPGSEDAGGGPLFPAYTTTVELPSAPATHDLSVPAP